MLFTRLAFQQIKNPYKLLNQIKSNRLPNVRNQAKQIHQLHVLKAQPLIEQFNTKSHLCANYVQVRGKKGRGKRASAQESDDESDSEDDKDSDSEETEDLVGKDYTDKSVDAISMRFDVIAKTIFGGTRSKVDGLFVEDRYRVDNERISRKSMDIKEGQQIDLIAGKCRDSDNKLLVHRVVILEVADKLNSKGRIHFKFRRYKPQQIDNYEDYPYEGTLTNDQTEP